jgi:hypothetical protein
VADNLDFILRSRATVEDGLNRHKGELRRARQLQRVWSVINYSFGIVMVVLAVSVPSVATFDPSWLSWMSYSAAVLTVAYLFLAPAVKVNTHKQRIRELEDIVIELQRMLDLDLSDSHADRETVRKTLIRYAYLEKSFRMKEGDRDSTSGP